MPLSTMFGAATFTKKLTMRKNNLPDANGRRQFFGTLTTGAAAMTLGALVAPIQRLQASPEFGDTAEEWFKDIKGKHRMVFDVTQPHEILPFAWPRVFLVTNEMTGTPAKDCSAVVVLRHSAIPYAMESNLWSKYNFGEFFEAEDPATKKPATRNPFWKPAKGDFKLPGVGAVAIGINELQESGVKFCVCDMALTVYSGAMAEMRKLDGAELKKEWVAGLLPGIQVVPSGVWAINRAQEKGCGYCFAG